MENKIFAQFEITINVLVSYFLSFEYLCYGSTVIIGLHFYFFQGRDQL